jgi:hypothetical protein
MRRSDAMGAVAELAASQHGAFTRRQAAARGLSSRQIASLKHEHILDEPTRGVLRFTSTPRTWHQRMAIATLTGAGFHAGFRAAAYLHEIDGFRRDPPVEIVGGPSARRVRGVIQHWIEPLPPDDLVVVDGIPCTGLARTVVDVCGLGDADLALRAVDDFERRGARLNWLRMTAQRLHRPGQSGTRVTLELLDGRQAGGRVPDSWFERLVERCLAIPGLPPWVRQHPVTGADGRLIGRVDLACPPLLLGVEAHSRQFHFGARPEALDQQRDNRFSANGWDLTYVGWYATEDPAVVAAMIREIAYRRASLLGVELPWAA